MADNYLERHRDDYERRKAEWLKHGKHFTRKRRLPRKPSAKEQDDTK